MQTSIPLPPPSENIGARAKNVFTLYESVKKFTQPTDSEAEPIKKLSPEGEAIAQKFRTEASRAPGYAVN
jgi:hypothetical protein